MPDANTITRPYYGAWIASVAPMGRPHLVCQIELECFEDRIDDRAQAEYLRRNPDFEGDVVVKSRPRINEYRRANGEQAYFVNVGTSHQVYLGPEEGGRWTTDVEPEAFYVVDSFEAGMALRATLRGDISGDENHPDFGLYGEAKVFSRDDYQVVVSVRPLEPKIGDRGPYE